MNDTARSVNGRPLGSGGGVPLRVFAALALPPETASVIAGVASAIAQRGAHARTTDTSNLHVTFAFLGNVLEEYVPAVAAALDAAAFAVPGPTACAVRDLRAFGDGVLGADVEVELLALLDPARDAFIDAVAPYAPDADRHPWHPHVSLVRVPRGKALPTATSDEARSLTAATWVAGDLRLYASLRMPGGGTTYRELHAVPLGEPVLRDGQGR